MFMGDEQQGSTLALLVARARMATAVFSAVVSRESTGEWIGGRLMGVASRDWTGDWGYHREVRQRTRADEFDRVVETFASDEGRIADDGRERSSLATSAKVLGMMCLEGILWKTRRARGPLGKITRMWEDTKANTREFVLQDKSACGSRERSGESWITNDRTQTG